MLLMLFKRSRTEKQFNMLFNNSGEELWCNSFMQSLNYYLQRERIFFMKWKPCLILFRYSLTGRTMLNIHSFIFKANNKNENPKKEDRKKEKGLHEKGGTGVYESFSLEKNFCKWKYPFLWYAQPLLKPILAWGCFFAFSFSKYLDIFIHTSRPCIGPGITHMNI